MSQFFTFVLAFFLIVGGTTFSLHAYEQYKQQQVLQQVQRSEPTSQQQESQREANIRAMHAMDAKMEKYSQCLEDYSAAQQVFIQSQCPNDPNKPYEYMGCASKAMTKFTFRDCREELF